MPLAALTAAARKAYADCLLDAAPWWDAVILTASNERQAQRYREEIETRRREGAIPKSALFLAVPDPGGERIGSGAATINALAVLRHQTGALPPRVLMIHSGGDSRRLPAFSAVGKLFGRLPGGSVFDQTLALSALWVARIAPGLLVASGDVIIEFDPAAAAWDRPGVTGIAMWQPVETGSQHGVYVADSQGRVYTFLQKPTRAQLAAAGGISPNDTVQIDTGIIRFDPETTARLAALTPTEPLDLYDDITRALTGERAHPLLTPALKDTPFHCSVVDGRFTHVGTTTHFQRVTGGGVIDSALAVPPELAPSAVVLECHLTGLVRAAAGSLLTGLRGIAESIEVPENTVADQVPVEMDDGRRGAVIRVYAATDDPKITGAPHWFGRPMDAQLASIGVAPQDVWPGIPITQRSLWNALLFPLTTPPEAWSCAKWMMGYPSPFTLDDWTRAARTSLETSSRYADGSALSAARLSRMQANWQSAALDLARGGSDLSPMLVQAPSAATLLSTGRALEDRASALRPDSPTDAASHFIHASHFLRRAGFEDEAAAAEDRALACVADAVARGGQTQSAHKLRLTRDAVTVSAPIRIDLGGGWSDTPPFCLDWGGTVLNIALKLNGANPIRTTVRRLPEQLFRIVSHDTGASAEYRSYGEFIGSTPPGDPLSLARAAVRLMGLAPENGGLEIATDVRLPLGSGLGTSSILGATIIRAVAAAGAVTLTNPELSGLVMTLEQLMTTGGGWQDQAGGIFPGAKLIHSGPGYTQRLRVQPLAWTPERKAEFCARLVLHYTGLQRIAKNLLKQVVSRYLARQTATVQVLHSLKTLASEMAFAMVDGDWAYLGGLLDRHWALNQVLDPNTTNAPVNALLAKARPFIHGAKLAGAGGGGFLILLAKSPEEAARLRAALGAGVHEFEIAEDGIQEE